MSLKIKRDVHEYGKEILKCEKYQALDTFIQHGNISCKKHSIRVAHISLSINRFLKLNCNEKSLVRGALLHDYFLYDWHIKEKWHNWHGFRHPKIAMKNAIRDFAVTELEQDIIKKHMWPLTIIPPRRRESWIVSIADKYCSTMETIKGLYNAV